jgi:hypothetical protein
MMKLFPDPDSDMFTRIGLLAWLPVDEVIKYYDAVKAKWETAYNDDKKRDKWRNHELYVHRKEDLQKMCYEHGLNAEGKKHDLVEKLAAQELETDVPDDVVYSGDLSDIPDTLTLISKLSISLLREVCKIHGILYSGVKEELALRVFLLRHRRSYLALEKEREALMQLLSVIRSIIFEQKRIHLDKIYFRDRKYPGVGIPEVSGKDARKRASLVQSWTLSTIDVPAGVGAANVYSVFEEIAKAVSSNRTMFMDTENVRNSMGPATRSSTKNSLEVHVHPLDGLTSVGSKIQVKLDEDDVQGTLMKPGWQQAEIQSYDSDTDIAVIVYKKASNYVYQIYVSELLASGQMQPCPA